MRESRRKVANEEECPEEKWLVAFTEHAKESTRDMIVRQFYAPGFYEAYDIVMSHAEKKRLEVVWFKEKRECGSMASVGFPMLEEVCTYCNKRFNHSEPIPCLAEDCSGEFCSRDCFGEHQRLKHP